MSKIVILGAGESGAGAAVLAKKEGFEVFVSDMSKIKDNYKKLMDDHNIEWEEGHHTEEKILDADEVIKSPGIPKEAPMIQKLIRRWHLEWSRGQRRFHMRKKRILYRYLGQI